MGSVGFPIHGAAPSIGEKKRRAPDATAVASNVLT